MNKFIFTVAMLCCFPVWAFEPAKDLWGATVVDSGECMDNGVPWECLALVKDGKKYLVMIDVNGPGKVYGVSVFKRDYTPKERIRIWCRIDA